MRRHLTPYSGSEGQELKAILVGCLRMTFARYCSALLQFNRGRCRERPARSRLSPFEVMDAHGAHMLRPRGRKASGNYAGWVWRPALGSERRAGFEPAVTVMAFATASNTFLPAIISDVALDHSANAARSLMPA